MNRYEEPAGQSSEPIAEPQPAQKPVPYRYLFGRPVYSEEQLAKMDPFLPPEPEWAAEWERRRAKKAGNQ